MIGKAFKIIDDKISEVLLSKGFKKFNNSGDYILFIKDSEGYKVTFDERKKRFDLFECTIEDGKEKIGKSISAWLFDPENDTEKEAKSIAEDFANTFSGTSRQKAMKKKKKSDDENNVSSLFLINRIANIFPELKDAVQEEKECYENFRGVTFAKEKALPLIKETLIKGEPKDKFKKLCTVFNNLYDSGDLDTRGIITIIFLNSIDDEIARENIKTQLSENLQAAMKEAYKIKDKKIKPEKIKKKRTFISDTLNAAQAQ